MNNPLVSVVIPIYNHERYIIACLNSVASQDYTPIEILLLDDGSTDNSWSVANDWINSFRSQTINCTLKRQTNSGVATTLNRLIEAATGDYIVPIASDDTLTSGSIFSRVLYLKSNPDKLAVIGDCHVIDQEENRIFNSGLYEYRTLSRRSMTDPGTLVRELAIKWELPGPILMARAKAYRQDSIGLYDPSISLEDRDFYLKLLSNSALGYIDQAVANYRLHGLNISQVSRDNQPLREKHLTDTVRIENTHSRKFKGLAKLGLILRSGIATQRLVILRSNSVYAKVRLASLLLCLGSVYWIHQLHTIFSSIIPINSAEATELDKKRS